MTTNIPTTPAEAVAQWCEEQGWTKNPKLIPDGTRFVRIVDGEVYYSGTSAYGRRPQESQACYYADLPKPELPTELGSLIVDVTDHDGDHYSHLLFDGRFWAGRTDGGEWLYIAPEHIASWHPGKVVRADDQDGQP